MWYMGYKYVVIKPEKISAKFPHINKWNLLKHSSFAGPKAKRAMYAVLSASTMAIACLSIKCWSENVFFLACYARPNETIIAERFGNGVSYFIKRAASSDSLGSLEDVPRFTVTAVTVLLVLGAACSVARAGKPFKNKALDFAFRARAQFAIGAATLMGALSEIINIFPKNSWAVDAVNLLGYVYAPSFISNVRDLWDIPALLVGAAFTFIVWMPAIVFTAAFERTFRKKSP
jgi:hypothetical protein